MFRCLAALITPSLLLPLIHKRGTWLKQCCGILCPIETWGLQGQSFKFSLRMGRKQDPSTYTNCYRRICRLIVLSAHCASQYEELGADTGTPSNNMYYIGRAPFSGQDPNLLAVLTACPECISP